MATLTLDITPHCENILKDNLLAIVEIEAMQGVREERDGMIHYEIEVDESDAEKLELLRRMMLVLMGIGEQTLTDN